MYPRGSGRVLCQICRKVKTAGMFRYVFNICDDCVMRPPTPRPSE